MYSIIRDNDLQRVNWKTVQETLSASSIAFNRLGKTVS